MLILNYLRSGASQNFLKNYNLICQDSRKRRKTINLDLSFDQQSQQLSMFGQENKSSIFSPKSNRSPEISIFNLSQKQPEKNIFKRLNEKVKEKIQDLKDNKKESNLEKQFYIALIMGVVFVILLNILPEDQINSLIIIWLAAFFIVVVELMLPKYNLNNFQEAISHAIIWITFNITFCAFLFFEYSMHLFVKIGIFFLIFILMVSYVYIQKVEVNKRAFYITQIYFVLTSIESFLLFLVFMNLYAMKIKYLFDFKNHFTIIHYCIRFMFLFFLITVIGIIFNIYRGSSPLMDIDLE